MTRASVLIVEEDSAVALDLKTKLHDLGHDVVGIVERGDLAVRLARAYRPSLVLVSMTLGGAMDGGEAAQMIGGRLGVPVIVMVGAGNETMIRRVANTAAYGHLLKPAQHKELHVAVEVALHKAMLERQLRHTERWFTATMRCAADGIVITGDNARIRILNAAAEVMTGWSLDQAMGHHVDEVLTYSRGEGSSRPKCQARRSIDDDCVIGFDRGRTLRTRMGRETLIDEAAAPFHHEHGRRSGAVVLLRDVASRLRYERFLQARAEQFHSEFDSLPEGVALLSLEGVFIQVNDALASMLGYSASELIGQSHEQITHPADRDAERSNLYEILSGGVPVLRYEKRYLDRERMRMLWAEVDAKLLTDNDEPVCYLLRINERVQSRRVADA